MIQAYNNISVSLPVSKEIRYPQKRRLEKIRVYDNVIDLNKRMPFYKLNLTRENRDFPIGIKDAAFKLKEKLYDMAEPEISGFNSKTIEVSDEEVLTAYQLDEELSGLPETMEIRIKQLSSVQVNKGKELLASSRGLAPGVYEFRAIVGKRSYNMIFYQSSRRDNLTTLREMADLLNSSIPGVNATVVEGSAREYYRLEIIADAIDEEGAGRLLFEEPDNPMFGVVDYMGLNRMEKAPALAEFEINGARRQTAVNSFKLENKLFVTLKNKSEEPVYIKIVPDSDRILKSVEDVLSSCNHMVNIVKRQLEAGNNGKSNFSANKLLSELKTLEDIYSEELAACGITADEDGSLHMDESIASLAVRTGRMEKFFTSAGFVAKLILKAEVIASNPMEYIDKTLVTYTDYKKNNYRYPYIPSMYSGLFCNTIC